MSVGPTAAPPAFEFARDTFAFRNELVWEYHVDQATGQTRTQRAQPPPAYAHRCFVMVRSVRQFRQHAFFDPALPSVGVAAYQDLVRRVVGRSPRRASAPEERVLIPGFRGLRDFSAEQEAAVKEACGGAWQSYFLRSHWRMVFPFSRRHQAREAESLVAAVEAGRLPIAHVVRFPQLTINHGLLLFAVDQDHREARFTAYDPNLPGGPAQLRYDRARRSFVLPKNRYWAGGQVDAFETYRGWFY